MNNSKHKIHIVGAGISGLIAATVLEQHGYNPVVIEASDSIGGRVKTDIVDGYQLDHGFQVLLTAYPAAQKYLDFESLALQEFVPGATIFKKGKRLVLGDPLRDASLLIPTLFSGIGTVSDKLKIFKLNKSLQQKTLSEIFETKEKTTLSYLQDVGFSSDIIDNFFKPFFSGIFLEPNLATSSRMFEYIYKMFGEGYATLPKAGIGAISEQLVANLSNTTFQFNTKVLSVKNKVIQLNNGERIESDFTILATAANDLIENLKGEATSWKSCDTLYFKVPKRMVIKPVIGLIPNAETLLNNIFFHTSLEMTHRSQEELLSVTIVKEHELTEEALVLHVQKELKEHCGIQSTTFLKRYSIQKALPDLTNVSYNMEPLETQLTSSIFLCGDTQLNGSLNAAMISGESAALGVVTSIDTSM